MSTSRKALRQAVGYDLAELYVGTVASGTTTSIICNALVDPDADETKHDRAWLKFTDGDAEGDVRLIRITDEDAGVSGYVPSTGGLTWARALDDAPSSPDEFEIHQLMDPDELDRRINTAITRLHYVNEEEITVVSGQREYSLSTCTWLTRRSQVLDVLWVTGSTALKKTYPPVNWFRIQEDAGALTLHVEPYAQETASQKMILLAERPYAELATDDATTDCPEDWIRAAAILEVYNWLVRTGPGRDTALYRYRRDDALRVYSQKTRHYKPSVPRRVQLKDRPKRGVYG